ncbi:MAG: carboxypeptidase regulatory-like domain-containing protein, partial [Candidatus Hydrogenedentes bacterium]|nr:carboxypeptidase regulatory-like domain-containing protein [Candidatus Hydrogenedentota bacterium]
PDYAATTSTLDGGNTITLPDGGILEGLVKEGGNPVSGAEVTVSVDAAFAPRTPAPVHTVTAVDGVFKFLGLTPGKVSVQVQHPDFGTRTETVTIAARQTATLNVDFGSRAARVSGSVVENGSPVSRAPVQLGVTTEQGPRNYETYTDSRGLFGFDNVAPGQARLRVDHRNMQRVTEFAIAAGDSVQRDIDFSGGTATVAGKVEGYDPGIYGASILALQGDVTLPQVAGPTFFKDLQPHLVAQTDAAPGGEYELSGLPAGQYTIAAVIVPRTGKGDRSQIRSSATKTTLAEGGSATLNFDFH